MSDLQRFVTAQERSYDTALREIRQGRKLSHWMWFIFPQIRGLGRSGTARHYGIEDLNEARAYLAHPNLGHQLIEISEALMAHQGTAPEVILGEIDAMKLRSCATLFEIASDGKVSVFSQVLDGFFHGRRCARTRALVGV